MVTSQISRLLVKATFKIMPFTDADRLSREDEKMDQKEHLPFGSLIAILLLPYRESPYIILPLRLRGTS